MVHIRTDSAQCGEAAVKIDQHALHDWCVAESNIRVETRAAVTDDQHVVWVIMTSVPHGQTPLDDLRDRSTYGNEMPVVSSGVPG
jgi:hypothetical protein